MSDEQFLSVMAHRRIEAVLGIIFLCFGIYLGYDSYRLNANRTEQAEKLAREHALLDAQVQCNNQILTVLSKRSDARAAFDLATSRAQFAMVEYLNDVNEDGGRFETDDPHLLNARDAFKIASEAGVNTVLWLPYPECSH